MRWSWKLKKTHEENPDRYTTNSSCENLLLSTTTAKEIVLYVTSKLPTPTSLLGRLSEQNIQQLASNTVLKENIAGNIIDSNDKIVAQSNRTSDITNYFGQINNHQSFTNVQGKKR